MSLHVGRSPWRHGLPKWGNITWSEISLPFRRFVFRMVEVSAKREWPVMNRNEPWEEKRRRAKRLCPLSPSLLPLCAHLHRERDVWAQVKCEMGKQKYKLERSIDLFYSFDQKHCKIIFYTRKQLNPRRIFFVHFLTWPPFQCFVYQYGLPWRHMIACKFKKDYHFKSL